MGKWAEEAPPPRRLMAFLLIFNPSTKKIRRPGSVTGRRTCWRAVEIGEKY